MSIVETEKPRSFWGHANNLCRRALFVLAAGANRLRGGEPSVPEGLKSPEGSRGWLSTPNTSLGLEPFCVSPMLL